MLCIESANTLNEEVIVEAKGTYLLKSILSQNNKIND